MNTLIKLFKKYRSIGVVGNSNTAKSSLILSELIDLKQKVKDVPVYVLGVEPNIETYLTLKGLTILHSSDDILDLKIRDSVIYIDEFAALFDVRMASKQTDKVRKFFNRIAHLNNYVVISSAEVNFWNKFMCSLVKAHLVKRIEYNNLVRGTFLKRKVQNIAGNTSDYRLDIPNEVYYVITDDNLVEMKTFSYDENIDSKRDTINPFLKLDLSEELKVEKEVEKEVEKKIDMEDER